MVNIKILYLLAVQLPVKMFLYRALSWSAKYERSSENNVKCVQFFLDQA